MDIGTLHTALEGGKKYEILMVWLGFPGLLFLHCHPLPTCNIFHTNPKAWTQAVDLLKWTLKSYLTSLQSQKFTSYYFMVRKYGGWHQGEVWTIKGQRLRQNLKSFDVQSVFMIIFCSALDTFRLTHPFLYGTRPHPVYARIHALTHTKKTLFFSFGLLLSSSLF